MNIYDVSLKAGVSIATVSRVINGNQNVSEKTRLKVTSVMNELGFTPNIFARGLGLNSMQTIGIMCPDSSDIYMANAIFYIERELRINGYNSILCCTGYNKESQYKSLDLLLSKRVDAIILIGSKFINLNSENNSLIKVAEQIPLMLINGELENDNIYSVICDDYHAIFNAVLTLVSRGRKRILYLYTSISQSGNNKRRGYVDGCKVAGLTLSESLIIQSPKDILAAKSTLIKAYDSGLEFDAVLTSDDLLAVGAVKFAHEKSISVPESISIVGYNNSIFSISTDPEITSIDTKVERLCVTTVANLMSLLSGNKVPHKSVIESEFIERATI